MKEYIYEAQILDAETDEVIVKILSFSKEGFEEEQGKSKWTEAIKRAEDKAEAEAEAEAEEKAEEIKEKEEEAAAELEKDYLEDKKMEEGIVSEDELTDMFGEGGKEEVKESFEKENL